MTDLTANPWPTLTEFLDAGGDLFALYAFKEFMEELFENEGHPSPERWDADAADRMREWAREAWDKPTHGRGPEENFAHCRVMSWRGDLQGDVGLRERVRALLTPEQRAEGERVRDVWQRTYPLLVGTSTTLGYDEENHWNCDGCGELFPRDVEAIIVGTREGHSMLHMEINYCRRCIAFALYCYDAGRVPS